MNKQWISLMAGLLLWLVCPAVQAAVVRVAAAADLKYALPEIAAAFETQSPHTLRISFGSSGQFSTQIQQGAPFELFLSADESYVQRLHRARLTQNQGVLYAIGRIVLFAPPGSVIEPEQGLGALKQALAQGQVKHFAIANPEHAPYGRAAREALQTHQLWPLPSSVRLLLGENAAQAAQFTLSGSVDAGILPYSLALALQHKGRFSLIPASAHQPLRQRMVLLKSAGQPAQDVYNYLQAPAARKIFSKYGFSLPE